MSSNAQKLNIKNVAAYVLLPGILPRLRDLFGTGFGYLAFLMASVFQGVRILPPTHPYLLQDNIGKYNILNVLAVAAGKIQFNRKNIDQVVVFGAVLLSIVLMCLQFLLFIIMLVTGKAFAQDSSAPFTSIFKTDHPETDIAFMMLDYVFGLPGVFDSNAMQGGPTPFHQGLHDLFQFYNLAILLVAVLIFLYYVVVVVVETAQTGIPFGRRFSKIYAPFRLIAAIGLLVPLNYGFNASQYITFYAAKLGSSFATNGWIVYNQNLDNPMGVKNASLIAASNPPDLHGLVYFATVYHACREIYNIYRPIVPSVPSAGTIQIIPYVIVDGVANAWSGYNYDQADKDFGQSDIEIVLGAEETKTTGPGGETKTEIIPYCGKLTVSLANQNPPYYEGNSSGHGRGGGQARGGVRTIEMEYYQMARRLFTDTSSKIAALGERAAHAFVPGREEEKGGLRDPCHRASDFDDRGVCFTSPMPSPSVLKEDINNIQEAINTAAVIAVDEMRNNIDLKLTEEMEKYGWGGAGIWYNRVAEINGAISSAIFAAPRPKAYPEVMEFVKNEKQKADTASGECQTFAPNLADNAPIKFNDHYAPAIAKVLHYTYKWPCERADEEGGVPRGMTGNVFLDVIGVLFGINGLFQLQDQTKMDPDTHMPEVHPLAALSSIGKALVENAIRSMATSLFFSFGGGMEGMMVQGLGAGLMAISKMFVNVATIGLTAGFILYYILPFLPFLYFFFAVGAWVKSIFEAMVGVPLWALAHLRIDGDGFSGKAAAGGYFLLFEIFLRPIVTLFGLIGGMAIFGASVAVLNEIFDVVVSNIVGAIPDAETGGTLASGDYEVTQMGAIDQFFFTIMYTILVYMMATSSFKLIDSIPKHVMQWLGTQVSTFNDNTGDPMGNLSQYTAIAGNSIAPKILGGINQGGQAAGGLISSMAKAATKESS